MRLMHAVGVGMVLALVWTGCSGDSQEVGAIVRYRAHRKSREA